MNRAINISSIQELLSVITDFRQQTTKETEFIYRGQNHDFDPLPTIYRPDIKRMNAGEIHAYTPELDAKDEKKLLERFKSQAVPYLNHIPQTDIEWLCIARHHGLPTRLLDWTSSPLTAALFALRKMGGVGEHINNNDERKSVILLLEKPKEISTRQAANPFEVKDLRLYYPPAFSPRIPAQNSVFTLQPHGHKFKSNQVTKIFFDVKKEICLMQELYDLGKTDHSVFPDIDGLCAALQFDWLFKDRV